MEHAAASVRVFRFGLFEADVASGTLTRKGVRVKIQDQPFRALALLLEHPGDIVTREDLRRRLWPEGTFVDFDGSLNVILKKLRASIDDDSDNPRFIETVPRHGYRLIVPVTFVSPSAGQTLDQPAVPSSSTTAAPLGRSRKILGRHGLWLRWRHAALVILVIPVALIFIARRRTGSQPGPVRASAHPAIRRHSIAVLGFRNISGKAGDAWLATAFSEMLGTELAGGGQLRLVSGEDIANLRHTSAWPQADSLDQETAARIGKALDSDFLVLGSYTTI